MNIKDEVDGEFIQQLQKFLADRVEGKSGDWGMAQSMILTCEALTLIFISMEPSDRTVKNFISAAKYVMELSLNYTTQQLSQQTDGFIENPGENKNEP